MCVCEYIEHAFRLHLFCHKLNEYFWGSTLLQKYVNIIPTKAPLHCDMFVLKLKTQLERHGANLHGCVVYLDLRYVYMYIHLLLKLGYSCVKSKAKNILDIYRRRLALSNVLLVWFNHLISVKANTGLKPFWLREQPHPHNDARQDSNIHISNRNSHTHHLIHRRLHNSAMVKPKTHIYTIYSRQETRSKIGISCTQCT